MAAEGWAGNRTRKAWTALALISRGCTRNKLACKGEPFTEHGDGKVPVMPGAHHDGEDSED
jgi:hypothetical protein